jgi:hypothetical protein
MRSKFASLLATLPFALLAIGLLIMEPARADKICSDIFSVKSPEPHFHSLKRPKDPKILFQTVLARLSEAAENQDYPSSPEINETLDIIHDVFGNLAGRPKNSDAGASPFSTIFRSLSLAEISKIAYDDQFATKFCRLVYKALDDRNTVLDNWYEESDYKIREEKTSTNYPVSVIQGYARILMGGAWLKRNAFSAKSLNVDQFRALAHAEKLEPSVVNQTFRFDARAPETIKNSGGFFPNPNQNIGPLGAHSIGASTGAGFISTSVREGNEWNINIGPVLLSAQLVTHPSEIEKKLLADFVKTHKSEYPYNLDGFKVVLTETFEYRIENVYGVRPDPEISVPEEREWISLAIDQTHIRSYRRVLIVERYMDHGNTGERKRVEAVGWRFGDWQDFSR